MDAYYLDSNGIIDVAQSKLFNIQSIKIYDCYYEALIKNKDIDGKKEKNIISGGFKYKYRKYKIKYFNSINKQIFRVN